MNTFKIYFKETTVLEIGGSKKTFMADTMYGFKFISDKEMKSIRKQLIGKNNATFMLTDDLLGCFKVIYGNKKPKDVSTGNLITLNKGKKNKGKNIYATKKSIEENLNISESNSIESVPPVSEDITIDPESEVGNNE